MIGCSWFGGQAKPGWIDGGSKDYPAAQYLTGVGQGNTRAVSEDQAYAALARIFKAEVSAQSKDWESYLVVESRGQSHDERRLTLDNLTRVSTDKVLENVKIIDRWYDREKGFHYALAGMDRSQAEAAFLERIAELDRSVQSDVEEARRSAEKLAKVRGLRRAIHSLILREAYNADLRVIKQSGQGTASAYRVQELTHELEVFLSTNLVVGVQVTGDHAEPVQGALTEGLIKEGLQVVGHAVAGKLPSSGNGPEIGPEVLVRGIVHVWPIDVGDPRFTYARWCSDFEVLDVTTQRVVGVLSKGGKEGHLSQREATAKVVRVMQQDMSTEVARAIAAHIYGETELPSQAISPAGCPQGESGAKAGTATH